jgi:hypothetical protein
MIGKRKKWPGRTAGCAALCVASLVNRDVRAADPAAGQDHQDQTVEQLRTEVSQLRAELRDVRREQMYSSRESVDAARAVIADADRRSLLIADSESPFSGGWREGKFTIQSADGNYVLHPWFQFMPRHVTNYREDAKNGDADIQNGFEIRRMKFGVDGNVFGKDLTYLFNWATNRKTGALELEEAWARYVFSKPWAVRVGQIKDPLAHEQLTSSKMLLAADRSLLNEAFIGGDDFVQAATLAFGDAQTPLQFEIAYTDGSQSANTNFQDDTDNDDLTTQDRPNWGAAARVQFKLAGDWKDYQDFTAMGTKKDLLVLGGGIDATQKTSTTAYVHTVDLQWENSTGLGAYGAYVGRYTDTSGGSDPYDWGFLVQVNWLFNRQWELFGRYDYIHFDEDTLPTAAEREVHEITIGVNYYMHGHAAKFTIDGTWLPNGSPIGADSIGVLKNDDNDEFILRGQFQLLL